MTEDTAKPGQAAQEGQAEREEESPVVAPLLTALVAQFGDRLDEAARDRARRQLQRLMKTAAEVAAYPLANGDEPGSVFNPRAEV
jgi:hypothetical protein